MVTLSQEYDNPVPAQTKQALPNRFNWWMISFLGLFLLGGYLDSWAHNHLAEELETFFTPWHAVLYFGFAMSAGYHVMILYRNVNRGMSWNAALPKGYQLSLFGIALFFVGGIGDMFWHEIFGIEVSIEGMISPPHLVLICGAALLYSGPLRATWLQRSNRRDWATLGPAVFSLLFTVSLVTLAGQFAFAPTQPELFTTAYGSEALALADFQGVSAVIITTVVWMAGLLLLILRWGRLPFGAVTVYLGINTGLMMLTRFRYVEDFPLILGVAILAGLAGDSLLQRMEPSTAKRGAFRLYAALVPMIYFGLYFGMLLGIGSLRWTIHVWTGVIVLSGLIAFLLSVLMLPPQIPIERAEAES